MSETRRRARARPVVVTLPAEIDIANAGQVGEQLSSAIAQGAGIVIADMTSTRFCDSSGISMLVQAHRQAAANGAELRLVVLATAVLRALKLVRMDFLLPIYPSLDAALAPDAQPERELPAPSRPARYGGGPAHVRPPAPTRKAGARVATLVALPGRRGRPQPRPHLGGSSWPSLW
jgi:anti-sigma B factor antagonist